MPSKVTGEKPDCPQLPDLIWLRILSFIDDSRTLWVLKSSGENQLSRVAEDWSLWKKVNVPEVKSKQELRQIVSFLGKHTRFVAKHIFFVPN